MSQANAQFRRTAALVPAQPVIAAICQYADGKATKERGMPLRRIVVRGQAASGLAALIDSAGPMTKHTRSCDRTASELPSSQALVFGYRAKPTATAAIWFTTCSLAVVAAGDRLAVLTDPVQSDLFALTSLTAHDRGPRTPGLIGMGMRSAAAVASRSRFELYVDGEAIARSSVGSVIFQVLPAGIPDAGPGTQVSVILAVRSGPACTAGQLALSFSGGVAGAGNMFGTVLVRDVSGQPCTLTGPLRLTGIDRAGRPVTRTLTFAVTGVAVLSPRTGPFSQRVIFAGNPTQTARGAFVGQLHIVAEYRDAPNGRYCSPLWVVPRSWRVVLPGGRALAVANGDRAGPGLKLVPSGGLVTCRGELAAERAATVGWTY